ncbi:MAG: hypothetical protein JW751_02930 [Polyangiaceae bacterium]|nr:hypothetical protein [Polyangiaceae bacterium]
MRRRLQRQHVPFESAADVQSKLASPQRTNGHAHAQARAWTILVGSPDPATAAALRTTWALADRELEAALFRFLDGASPVHRRAPAPFGTAVAETTALRLSLARATVSRSPTSRSQVGQIRRRSRNLRC